MWLDDDEIRQRLQSGEADAVAEALDAIQNRWEAGEGLSVGPLDAATLAPLAVRADYGETDRLLRHLLGGGGVPAAEGDLAFDEIARLVAYYVPLESMHAAAIALEVHTQPVDAAGRVVTSMGVLLPQVDPDRVGSIELFVSFLLDGEEPVRCATTDAVRGWPNSAAARAIAERLAIA